MIAYIDIKVNAAHPNLPLLPFYAFQGSPSSVRVVGVPQRIGKWDISAVSVSITLPDNSATTVPAVNVDGCWVATLPSSDVTGYCAAGLQVTASGTDENGAAVTGYCLGVGDVTILSRDAVASSDGTRYYLHYVAEQPESPNPGDMCYISGDLKWYNGTAWQPFATIAGNFLTPDDIADPSTSAATGKVAGAKATGDALALKADATAVAAALAQKQNTLTFDTAPTENSANPVTSGGVKTALDAKADAADLRYALAEPTTTTTQTVALPDSAFPIRFMDDDVEFYITEASALSIGADEDVIFVDANSVLLAKYHLDGSLQEDMFGEATYGYGTTGATTTPPSLVISTTASATLADRAVNFVGGAFSTLALTLPTQQADYSRDFYVRVINPADAYPVTITGATLQDASGAAVTLSASAGAETTWRFTEVLNGTDTPTNPIFLVTGANETAAIAGKYAKPSGGIPKTDMAQEVQTSLGKADTAVQPAALAGAVRYDLPANATTIASASQEVVEGVTVNYGEATLADRTANRVAITAEIAELRLTFPAAISGKVRDFGLRVEVGTGSAALTAPALVPVEPTGETITLENPDGEIPAFADGAADAKGVTLLYFSETAPGKFLVKGEEVKEA